MSYLTEDIAKTLKEARERKELSQRALSKKSGVPQSHISKIESGAVDLRLSSLIELARVLELELTLVPRKTMPAVQSIVRTSAPSSGGRELRKTIKELDRLQNTISRLSRGQPAMKELAQLQSRVHDLQRLNIPIPDIETLKGINRAVEAFQGSINDLQAVRDSLSSITQLRNALAHAVIDEPKIDAVRPAYRLDDDDDDDDG